MEAARAFLLLLARVLAFTSTAPVFAAEVWFKFRKVLQKWQKAARNVALAPKQRTVPLSVSWSNCLNLPLCRTRLSRRLRRFLDVKTRPGQCVQGLLVYGFTAGRVSV